MSYKSKDLYVSNEIRNSERFKNYTNDFFDKYSSAKISYSNDYITIKGTNNQIAIFEAFIDDFHGTTNKGLVDFKLINGSKFRPLNKDQEDLIKMISEKDITFVSGCAGTGKTMVSTIIAAFLLKRKKVDKIVLTRPAIEANAEKIGFLPGDTKDKMLPYLMSFYDYLKMVFTEDEINVLETQGKIEIIPLAYMRGRSLSKCVILVDESQNTNYEQVKMIISRIGHGSKIIFCGDVSQNDLGKHTESGLSVAERIFKDVNEIGIINMGKDSIVRHPLITKLLDICEEYEANVKDVKKMIIKG